MSDALYRTGFGQRYSMNPEMAWTGQTLGHHQWGVAVLLLELFPDCSMATLKEALLHDTGEPGAGADVSAPAKRKYPALAKVAHAAEIAERHEMGVPPELDIDCDYDAILLCDRLEAYLFARVRTPWVLEQPDWQEGRARLLDMAETLGVREVVEKKLT